MTLRQTLQEIIVLQREIQQQLLVIESFKKTNRDNMALIKNELQGSAKGYDATMVQSLHKAEASLNKSASALQAADAALQQVRAI
ncbi:MAG: hypothetical protein R2722_11045 [Tessaracoccus sp.]